FGLLAEACVIAPVRSPALFSHLTDNLRQDFVLFLHGLKNIPNFVELGAIDGSLHGFACGQLHVKASDGTRTRILPEGTPPELAGEDARANSSASQSATSVLPVPQ